LETYNEALGSNACMIRAFTSGMIGSSFLGEDQRVLPDVRNRGEARPSDPGQELEEEPVLDPRRSCSYGTFGIGEPPTPRDIEPGHLDLGVDPVDERLGQVEARADAVAKHRWRPGCRAGPDAPDVVAEDRDAEEPVTSSKM
jgi:hypothetical protein